jgi:pimeloyl-ACP methyl ester carboxylesterase
MAHELHTLLRNAGIPPPYVLIGHSMGGLIARIFIHRYPGEVVGLALIDSSHPHQAQRQPRTSLRDYPGGMLITAALQWAHPLGLNRLRCDLGFRNAGDPGWSQHRRADAAELLGFKAICRETGELDENLGGLPLAVVTSAERDPNYSPGSRAERARGRFYSSWVILQNELADLSTDSTHIVAEQGGHHLNRDNPDLVSQAVTRLIQQIRRPAR